MSQNATPVTEFAPCNTLRSADNAIRSNTTRRKCCACHEKCRRISPKCCACHDKMKPEVSRWCESIAPATQNRRGHAEETRFGSHLRTAVTRRLASYRAKESFKKDGCCSFPHRHCKGTKEASDPSQDTLEHHKKHFVRDFLTFHTSQLQNRRFPTSFLTTRPQNRRFVRGLRRFSSHVTKCHACHGICTL